MVSWIEIDITDPFHVLAEAEEPVLSLGKAGTFDDAGCSIGCILPIGQKRFMYYMGWHLTTGAPWQNAVGLAISEGPGEPFIRLSEQAIIPLDDIDPYTISYPWVIEDGGRYRMWYGSNLTPGFEPDEMVHVLRYAESVDGVNWERKEITAVDLDFDGEYAICRPCVVKDADRYRMWFSSRGESYRIRYAESTDGNAWTRFGNQIDLDISAEGWDSQMVEYPCVFDHRGRRYMLYAGDGFGKSGFGLAVQTD